MTYENGINEPDYILYLPMTKVSYSVNRYLLDCNTLDWWPVYGTFQLSLGLTIRQLSRITRYIIVKGVC